MNETKDTAMTTLEKRTFIDGSSVELFKRNDGTHRIKYLTSEGDELTLNLSTKDWAKMRPEYEFRALIEDAEHWASRDRVCGSDNYLCSYIAAIMMARCEYSVRSAADKYAKADSDKERIVPSEHPKVPFRGPSDGFVSEN